MITIEENIIQQLIEHAKRERPIEACGYLAGKERKVEKFYPMKNVDQSRKHFTLDPQEQFDVLKKSRSECLDLLAVFHSHPETPARPSAEDIKLAFDPRTSYVILSLIDNSIKSFKIKNGEVEKEDLEVLS